jgi:hypothetical protein
MAGAQSLEDSVAACHAIQNDIERLNCFDALPVKRGDANARPAGNAPIQMSLLDLKLEKDRLIGKTISTTGHFKMTATVGMLFAKYDPLPLVIDIGGLSQDDKSMLEECGYEGCEVSLVGTVAPLAGYGTGLKAKQVSKR